MLDRTERSEAVQRFSFTTLNPLVGIDDRARREKEGGESDDRAHGEDDNGLAVIVVHDHIEHFLTEGRAHEAHKKKNRPGLHAGGTMRRKKFGRQRQFESLAADLP